MAVRAAKAPVAELYFEAGAHAQLITASRCDNLSAGGVDPGERTGVRRHEEFSAGAGDGRGRTGGLVEAVSCPALKAD